VATRATIEARVQARVGDLSTAVFDTVKLDGLIASAYEKVQADFEETDVETVRATADIGGFPAGATVLSLTTSPSLPADFFLPVLLWEKFAGSDDATYTPVDRVYSALPNRNANEQATLGQWLFTKDQITFVAATEARDLRLTYYRNLDALVLPTDVVGLANATNAIVSLVCYMAVLPRGSGGAAATFLSEYEAAISQILNIYAKNDQNVVLTRKYRGGRQRWIYR
jgi:hypothetical protein